MFYCSSPVPKPACDLTLVDHRHEATISTLQFQLKQCNIDIAFIDKKAQKTYKKLQHQIQLIAGKDRNLPDKHQEDLAANNPDNSAGNSQFEQLRRYISAMPTNTREINQLNAVVDVLAKSSVDVEKFCQLETIVKLQSQSSMSRDFVDQLLLEPTRQQIQQISELRSKMTDTDSKSAELWVFVDELAKISDPQLRQAFHLQQLTVNEMAREHAVYRQKLETNIRLLHDKIREDISTNLLEILSRQR